MKTCSNCGKQLTLLNRDLSTGLCADCARQLANEKKAAAKAEDAERERRYAERSRTQAAVAHGIPTVYPKGCPHCGGKLQPITLVGRERGMGIDTTVAYYTVAPHEQGVITGRHTIAGEVKACLCESCHRICFHGVPAEKS